MYDTPKLSIIVPCYNHARFLPARLESISKQSFTDFEIILLDDGSSDASQSVLEAYATQEARVSVKDFSARNGGRVNDQWIKGVNLARGEYIWIAESDDECSLDFLEVLLHQFEKSPQISLAYCDSMIIDETGKHLTRYDYSDERFVNRWQKDFVIKGNTFIKDHMVFKNVIPNVSAVLFKKDSLQQALQKNTLKYCADYFCYVRLLSNSEIAYVNRPLNYFRTHIYTTRWHSQSSYQVALKEKIAVLKEIKKMNIPASTDNISRAYRWAFKNRHKFKRINRLYKTLDQKIGSNKRFALYGFNDICEYVLQDYGAYIPFSVIFDNNKEKDGFEKNGVVVKRPSETALNAIDVIVICSLAHKEAIRASLKSLQFHGDMITL